MCNLCHAVHNSNWSIMSNTTLIKNNGKVKSYSYGELNCGGLHILITFIYAYRGLSLLHCLYPTSTHSNDKPVLARAPLVS